MFDHSYLKWTSCVGVYFQLILGFRHRSQCMNMEKFLNESVPVILSVSTSGHLIDTTISFG